MILLNYIIQVFTLSDFYMGKWNLFFNEYSKPAFSYEIFDNLLTTWEYDWCTKTNLPLPENVNPIKQVEKMMRRMEDNFITMHN